MIHVPHLALHAALSADSWEGGRLSRPVSVDWLHPQLVPELAMLARVLEWVQVGGPAVANRCEDWRNFRNFKVRKWAPGVYSVPYLCPALCILLRDHMANLGHMPNDEEEPEAQIQECVLNHEDPELFGKLNGLWMLAMPALAELLLQLEVKSCLSIQGAVYTPDGTSETQWHQDIDSEFTAVVALSDPASFDASGTDVWRDGEQYTVPPLPIGHAMVFAGRTTLHKGNTVHAGERHLLVHWCNQNLSMENIH